MPHENVHKRCSREMKLGFRRDNENVHVTVFSDMTRNGDTATPLPMITSLLMQIFSQMCTR